MTVFLERKYFRVENAVLGPSKYWRGDDAEKYADRTGWPDVHQNHSIKINVDRWVFPGLVLAVRWRSVPQEA